jgi:hypothetical protein
MQAPKPLDAGTGRLCASFDATTAAWLSLGAPHDRHGFVEVTALPNFDEGLRGDAVATRAHRLAMTLGEHAFLAVEIDGNRPALVADPSDPTRPRWTGSDVTVEVRGDPDGPVLLQHWVVGPERRGTARLVLRGVVDRPALAEITEIDPPTPTGARTTFAIDGATVRLEAAGLPATAIVSVAGCRVAWRRAGASVVGTLARPRGDDVLAFTLEATIEPVEPLQSARIEVAETRTGDRLTDRSLAYVRGCTVLRVAADERAILTDHRILPLSWTRDAYWQALVLLAVDDAGDRERVADHLRWLWRRCERPDGRWVRSHHANGRRKDAAFQADQQLYPLVELADYWRLTESLPDGVDWSVAIDEAWRAAVEAVDADTGLMASSENAADDPAAAPFIGASQILLWYAGMRVAEVAAAADLGLDVASLRGTATAVRRSFDAAFGGGKAAWPHAVDRAGRRIAYHDANDLPVAIAPLWGFCDASHAGWRATMSFAFSDANPAWVGGRRPGLGSAHTPGAWTLGDVQAWIRARIERDPTGTEAAMARLEEMAFADGMLPEAYAEGDPRIRHWFAWPGAALAALRLLDAAGALDTRLSVAQLARPGIPRDDTIGA